MMLLILFLFNDTATTVRYTCLQPFSLHSSLPVCIESQMRMPSVAGNLAVAVTAIALAGCQHYVKQEDYDAAISELLANDAAMRSDLDSLKSQLDRDRKSVV